MQLRTATLNPSMIVIRVAARMEMKIWSERGANFQRGSEGVASIDRPVYQAKFIFKNNAMLLFLMEGSK